MWYIHLQRNKEWRRAYIQSLPPLYLLLYPPHGQILPVIDVQKARHIRITSRVSCAETPVPGNNLLRQVRRPNAGRTRQQTFSCRRRSARKQLPALSSDRRRSPGYRAPAGLNFTGCWTALGRRGVDEAGDTISTDQAPRPAICSLSARSRSAGGDWKTGRTDAARRASTTSALRDSARPDSRAGRAQFATLKARDGRLSEDLAGCRRYCRRMQVTTEPKRRSRGTKLRRKTSPDSAFGTRHRRTQPIAFTACQVQLPRNNILRSVPSSCRQTDIRVLQRKIEFAKIIFSNVRFHVCTILCCSMGLDTQHELSNYCDS